MIIHLSSVDSTNTVAKQLLQDYDSVVVSADEQTSGRGRNGKTWEGQPRENLYISFGYRHNNLASSNTVVGSMYYSSLAVVAVLRELCPMRHHRIKYPNDIQTLTSDGWAKVSGILVEHEFVGSVCVTTTVGIGINVRQTVFPDTISQNCTSLLLQEADLSVNDVRNELLQQMTYHSSIDHEAIFRMWCDELQLVGRQLRVAGSDGTWMVQLIQPDGRLLVQNTVSHEQRIIDNGDTIRYDD
jgi:BirA family transcriptional regulator, biotin operon repressor / biotin---[acetyl-CoA-carboxylase] ligase